MWFSLVTASYRPGVASCGKTGKSRTIGAVRRGFTEAAVLVRGYQASEVASFLGCHASDVSRALQSGEAKCEHESQV